MEFDTAFHAVGLIFQVFLLDLILSGDNAVVIALACRSLPSRQVQQAMMIGTGAAIGLRVLLTTVVSWLLQVSMLKLIGAVFLIVIAIRLLVEEEQDVQLAGDDSPSSLWGAVITVLTADLVMSLDNVVALAAVAQGSTLYLVFGLLLSVPLLMFGSKLMIHLLHRYPMLVPACGALLGYVAGSIAVSDPAIADAVSTQSPALTLIVPLLCAVFVVMESRIIVRRRAQLPRPATLKVMPKSMAPAPVVAVSVVAATAETPPTATLLSPVALHTEATVATTAAPDLPTVSTSTTPAFMGLLAATAVIVLVAVLLNSVGGNAKAEPDSDSDKDTADAYPGATATAADNLDSAYVCPGATMTIYYRHGGSTVHIVAANGEATGYVDSENAISWDNVQALISKLHFTPPDKIEDDAKTVTINGGSFPNIHCVRPR
jgi:YjbE family integral membrane protein